MMLTSQKNQHRSFFNLLNVVYCLGAVVVFYTLINLEMFVHSTHGSHGLLYVSLAYAVISGSAGIYLLKVKKRQMVGGLFLFFCLVLFPVIAYAFLDLLGWNFDDEPGEYVSLVSFLQSGWLAFELSTILFTSVTIYFFRFPFFTLILYPVLWFACCIDIFPYLLFKIGVPELSLEEWVSIFFGIALIGIAICKDRKGKSSFVPWEYFFGLLTFCFGISLIMYESELSYFVYCLINLVLIVLGPLLNRMIFIIFGGIGLANYLGQLAFRFLGNSVLFSIVLGSVGLAILSLGIILQRRMRKA